MMDVFPLWHTVIYCEMVAAAGLFFPHHPPVCVCAVLSMQDKSGLDYVLGAVSPAERRNVL